MVRVLPDVAALDRAFDYLVPEQLSGEVGVGTVVRIALHGRRVGGWVVADDVTPPPGVALRPVAKVTGLGPPPDVVELAGWAAWRWAGTRAVFLRAASPRRRVAALPAHDGGARSAGHGPPAAAGTDLVREALGQPRAVVRLPPSADPFLLVEAACARGDALVLTPSVRQGDDVAQRLRAAGRRVARWPQDWARAAAGGAAVVGGRGAAWAPVPELAAVVAVDVHDEAYQDERAPTWNGWQVAAERARRAGVPCVVLSPCPPLEVLSWGPLLVPSRGQERAGWPAVEVVDRRHDDPRSGLYSDRLVELVRSGASVACVLNRKGRARLLACASCGEVARCERCGAAVEQPGGDLRCRACGTERPVVCLGCGAQRLRVLRAGVSRAREELEALVGAPVGEVSAETEGVPPTPVVVGTEAALHRLGHADAAAFLDFDQELLAPRFRAGEQALALLARAARLVGGRSGRVLVQTRLPGHEVLDAALHADPGRLVAVERRRRAALGLPPETALAEVSGAQAAAFVAGLPSSVEVLGPHEARWRVRAPDHTTLCDALAAAPRRPGRLRVEVDPQRS